MIKTCAVLGLFLLFHVTARAQAPQPRFVRAFGEATVSSVPDQAKIQFAVVTQAATADAASSQNATLVSTLMAALRAVIGQSGDTRTLAYSLNPNYSSPRDGSQPVIIGYTASNTVEATSSDLLIIGKLIDTAIQAGANRVQGLQFSLKNDQPARQQALRLATAQAKAHADAMASGLNLKTGAVVALAEGVAVSVEPLRVGVAAAAPTTPIESGQVDVHATVTLEVELTQ
jgi:uncharacterized protein YggE